jgi:hypothetical protein
MQGDKTILVTPFYIPEKESRLKELEYCIHRNNKNILIDLIVLVVERETPENLIPTTEKIKIEWVDKRPSYQDLFNIALNNIEESKGFMIIANSDIFYAEDDIYKIKERIRDTEVFALSRCEFNFRKPHIHHDTWDSQDIWIFKDKILPGNYDIKLGIPGCDNKIAYEFHKDNYKVWNPSFSIICYHKHNIRIEETPEHLKVWHNRPYLLPNACSLENINDKNYQYYTTIE